MKRRTFIASGALAAAPLAFNVAAPAQDQKGERSLIEWRTYRIRFRGDASLLMSYLRDVYKPAMQAAGADQFFLFKDYSLEEPQNIYVTISYPDAATYIQCQQLIDQQDFRSSGSSYHALPEDRRIYNRYESWLLHAFEGAPKVNAIDEGNELFELRTYEGYSEDAVRRKILMFNKEEIDLFYKVGLNPVYFGDMIAGPYRPCLSYLLQFKNLEERDAQWEVFFDHPEWKRMFAAPEYANSVSHIHKKLLIRA